MSVFSVESFRASHERCSRLSSVASALAENQDLYVGDDSALGGKSWGYWGDERSILFSSVDLMHPTNSSQWRRIVVHEVAHIDMQCDDEDLMDRIANFCNGYSNESPFEYEV